MKIILLIFLLLISSGCTQLFSFLKLPEEQTTSQIIAFQDLLKQGWEIQVVNERVLLIKKTQNQLLIQDIFNITN